MSIRWVDTPRTLTHFEKPPPIVADFDNELGLDSDQVQHVAELFNTPLTGAYNWDYTTQDDRIRKLYELGKQLNWNASVPQNGTITIGFIATWSGTNPRPTVFRLNGNQCGLGT